MATIKLNTGGSVILKGGKPSCACCGACSPEVTTLYAEYVTDPLGTPTTSYIELTGSLNDGLFEGTGPNGTISLQTTEYPDYDWDYGWFITDPAYDESIASTTRCDPTGVYIDGDGVENEYSVTISFTPLP